MTQGETLKLFREKEGFSQSQFANAIGMGIRKIQSYEQGIHNINVKTCEEFARFFNVPVDYFIGSEITNDKLINCLPMSKDEKKLFKKYLSLNQEDREKLLSTLEFFSET